MHVPVLCSIGAMRLAVAIIALVALECAAQAEPPKPVRVIAITKENAEKSAAAIAAGKSPFIGVPPRGKVMRTEPDWRNARAALPVSEGKDGGPDDQATLARLDGSSAEGSSDVAPDRAQVQIIKPGKAGPIVETRIVPRHDAGQRL
jgi:hypothetical protein